MYSLFCPFHFGLVQKITIFAIIFVYARAILPRYRYDQLMNLGWKILLPLSFGYLIFIICILSAFNMYSY
jgi:NADH:ubiquinone oxidoreductase subunit H